MHSTPSSKASSSIVNASSCSACTKNLFTLCSMATMISSATAPISERNCSTLLVTIQGESEQLLSNSLTFFRDL